MSAYVIRCERCRQVRGRTSFKVLRAGERAAICRWCDERSEERRLYELEKRAERLTRQLADIRKEQRTIRARRRSEYEEEAQSA